MKSEISEVEKKEIVTIDNIKPVKPLKLTEKPVEKELTKKEEKELLLKAEMEKVKQAELKVQEQWKKDLKKGDIIQQPEYFEMQHHINMVIQGLSNGSIISSRGGTGKTYTTLNILEKSGMEYAYIDSYSTPSAFYIWLYKNKDKIKVIDDVAKLLESEKFSPFLKAVLWEIGTGCRIVSYNSTKNLIDPEYGIIPNEFEETGGCIILVNKVNEKNVHVDAILSRVNYVKLEISNEKMLKNMEFVAKKPYKELNITERMEVYHYLKEKFKDSIDLNLRTLIKGFQFYEYAKTKDEQGLWQRLLLGSLKQDDALVIMEKVLADESLKNEESKQEEFEKLYGKKIGRATYFRYKDKVESIIKNKK